MELDELFLLVACICFMVPPPLQCGAMRTHVHMYPHAGIVIIRLLKKNLKNVAAPKNQKPWSVIQRQII